MARLVLIRHGESEWNSENRLSGWSDTPLSPRGRIEAERTGIRLRNLGFSFDCAFSSVLKRSIQTLWIVLSQMDCVDIPVCWSWRLNERHYGILEGRTKDDLYAEYGWDQVEAWRNDFSARPPPMAEKDPRHPGQNPLYEHIPLDLLPSSESLEDALYRMLPFWRNKILPALEAGRDVVVVSHRTSIRALILYLEGIPAVDIGKFDVPTSRALVYEFGPLHPPTRCRFPDGPSGEENVLVQEDRGSTGEQGRLKREMG